MNLPLPAMVANPPSSIEHWEERLGGLLKATDMPTWQILESHGARPWSIVHSSYHFSTLLEYLFDQPSLDLARRWCATYAEIKPLSNFEKNKRDVIRDSLYHTHGGVQGNADTGPEDYSYSLLQSVLWSPQAWAWPLAVELVATCLPESRDELIWEALLEAFEYSYPDLSRPGTGERTPAPVALCGRAEIARLRASGWLSDDVPSRFHDRWERVEPRLPKQAYPVAWPDVSLTSPPPPPLPPADVFMTDTNWSELSIAFKKGAVRHFELALSLGLKPTDRIGKDAFAWDSAGQRIGLDPLCPASLYQKFEHRFPDKSTWLASEDIAPLIARIGTYDRSPKGNILPALGQLIYAHLSAHTKTPATTPGDAWWSTCLEPLASSLKRSLKDRLSYQETSMDSKLRVRYEEEVSTVSRWLDLSLSSGWLNIAQLDQDAHRDALDLVGLLDNPQLVFSLFRYAPSLLNPDDLLERQAFRLLAVVPAFPPAAASRLKEAVSRVLSEPPPCEKIKEGVLAAQRQLALRLATSPIAIDVSSPRRPRA